MLVDECATEKVVKALGCLSTLVILGSAEGHVSIYEFYNTSFSSHMGAFSQPAEVLPLPEYILF